MISKKDEKFLILLGQKLRDLRHEKGWTLEQVEEEGWPSWRHLQKIESGKNVTILTLNKLSKIYKVSLSELLEDL